jgi:hypothetical protein
MFTTQTGRLVRKFFILGALVVSIAAPTRLNEAAVQLPCCQACLNTYRNCLTGCGSDFPCKQRCYDTYYSVLCKTLGFGKKAGLRSASKKMSFRLAVWIFIIKTASLKLAVSCEIFRDT